MSISEIFSSAASVIVDWGLAPFLVVAAVIGVAAFLYARLRMAGYFDPEDEWGGEVGFSNGGSQYNVNIDGEPEDYWTDEEREAQEDADRRDWLLNDIEQDLYYYPDGSERADDDERRDWLLNDIEQDIYHNKDGSEK